MVHGVAKSRTRLSNFTFTFHFHTLEKEMATHSSVLAWRIPGTGEPGGLPSVGSHRVGHDWSDSAAAVDQLCLYLWNTLIILSERKQLRNGYCNSLQKWVQGWLFFLPYASIFYIINVNYVAVRKAYIYFLRNFLKKCYPALKHSKQINYSGTEICIWSNVVEKEH